MKTKLIGLALFGITAATVVFYPAVHSTTKLQNPPPVISQLPMITERPRIEVVFVLDTTSSMSGFIDAAKEKIWSIASTMASAQPAPDIRMGLVAFRDRGDAYVTRVTDLSADLDTMYATLLDFRAEGGGDGPESVNQALYDAVHRISWSQNADAYQVIFLVGDAPAHMDYQGDVPFTETIRLAGHKGIIVNTIQSGAHPDTRNQWHSIASLAQGEFFEVAQSGGALAIETPFDDELAELSAEMDETRLFYGTGEEMEAKQSKLAATVKLHERASVQSRARRAAYNATAAGRTNFLLDGDLVSDVESGRVDLADVPSEALPSAMQALSKDDLADAVENAGKKRERLNARIESLAQQRDEYLHEEASAHPEAEESLDHKLYRTLKAQIPAKGLSLSDSPSY